MKNKIERGCYGKEDGNKFQASDNWFQRFKHRGHNISVRRRTKKKNAANVGRKSHSIVSQRTKYGGPQVHSEFQTTPLILNLTPNSKNSLRIKKNSIRILKTYSEFKNLTPNSKNSRTLRIRINSQGTGSNYLEMHL